jgi:hypothetical protein
MANHAEQEYGSESSEEKIKLYHIEYPKIEPASVEAKAFVQKRIRKWVHSVKVLLRHAGVPKLALQQSGCWLESCVVVNVNVKGQGRVWQEERFSDRWRSDSGGGMASDL